MRSNLRVRIPAVLVAAAMLTGSSMAQAPSATAIKKGTVERIKAHGKSLEGNLEGDSPDRDVFVYLPPGYAANTAQRYPVVYMLHGYGLTAERWMPFTRMADAADKNIAAGIMREMIFDVGLQDGLAASNMQLTASLNNFNIRHTFETYEGDLTNRVPERIEQRVLPFFSNSLSFTARK